jgi:2-methylcitrate dehydratase PrpD
VTPQIIGAVLRHLLGAVGAVGWMSDSDAEQVAGALALLVTIGWSIWQKRQARDQAVLPR